MNNRSKKIINICITFILSIVWILMLLYSQTKNFDILYNSLNNYLKILIVILFVSYSILVAFCVKLISNYIINLQEGKNDDLTVLTYSIDSSTYKQVKSKIEKYLYKNHFTIVPDGSSVTSFYKRKLSLINNHWNSYAMVSHIDKYDKKIFEDLNKKINNYYDKYFIWICNSNIEQDDLIKILSLNIKAIPYEGRISSVPMFINIVVDLNNKKLYLSKIEKGLGNNTLLNRKFIKIIEKNFSVAFIDKRTYKIIN